MKRIFEQVTNLLKSCAVKVYTAFDVRDFLVYGGLISLGYGFYLLFPWLGFVVYGAVSMLFGLGWLIRIPKK
jgi:hypothetical protein